MSWLTVQIVENVHILVRIYLIFLRKHYKKFKKKKLGGVPVQMLDVNEKTGEVVVN